MTDEDLDAKGERLMTEDMTRGHPNPNALMAATLGTHVVDWSTLDAPSAATEWKILRAWVQWFTHRYNIPPSVVPKCWWKHPQLVEELSGLRSAHRVAFDKKDTGYGPLGWHERLANAHPRLQRAGAGCTNGHNSTRPRDMEREIDETDEAEWTAWITQTHA